MSDNRRRRIARAYRQHLFGRHECRDFRVVKTLTRNLTTPIVEGAAPGFRGDDVRYSPSARSAHTFSSGAPSTQLESRQRGLLVNRVSNTGSIRTSDDCILSGQHSCWTKVGKIALINNGTRHHTTALTTVRQEDNFIPFPNKTAGRTLSRSTRVARGS